MWMQGNCQPLCIYTGVYSIVVGFPGSLSYIRGLSANKVLPDLIGSCSNFKTLGNHPYVGPNKFGDIRPYEYTLYRLLIMYLLKGY